MGHRSSFPCLAAALLAAPALGQNTKVVTLSPAGEILTATLMEATPDLRYLGLMSQSSQLDPTQPPPNNFWHVFLADVPAGTYTPASVSAFGDWADGNSWNPSISLDGTRVAFESYATNLVPGDLNAKNDVFVKELDTGAIERISVGPGGVEGNQNSYDPSISADGRFVSFTSDATNLVPGDVNGVQDVFVRDRLSGVTERVSVDSAGVAGNGVSRTTSISGDGRYVAFASRASNLVAGDTNGDQDVFVRDRVAGTTWRVSEATGGIQANNWSYEPVFAKGGTAVVFESIASNLAPNDEPFVRDIFHHRLSTGVTTLLSQSTLGAGALQDSNYPAVSAEGRFVSFSTRSNNLIVGDTNNAYDIFLRDTLLGVTTRVSLGPGGVQSDEDHSWYSAMSPDGVRVLFNSADTDLVPGVTFTGTYSFGVYEYDPTAVPADVFCTAKVNSAGCTPQISATGTPGYAGPDDWHVSASDVINGQFGILIWSLDHAALPFGGGTLCLAPPVHRTGAQLSGGSATGNDCTGSYDFHFGQAFLLGNLIPAGTVLFTQYWSRDPALVAPENIGLTAGLWFFVLP